jgi:hypothetical protein
VRHWFRREQWSLAALLVAFAACAVALASQASAAVAAPTDLKSAIAAPSVLPASAHNLTGEWAVKYHCEFTTGSNGCQYENEPGEPCENDECSRIVPFYQEEGSDLLENLFDHDQYGGPGSNYPYHCSEPAPNEGGPLRSLCGIATGNSFEYKECLNTNVPPERCGSLWLEESGTVSANGLSWTGTYKVGSGKYGSTPLEGGTTTATRITSAEPTLSIAGTTVAEPTSGTGTANFSVSLNEPATSAVSVEYTTQNGSGTRGAVAGRDYEATHGTLTFNPGETTKTIPVTLKASGFKGKRTFSVALSNAQNANIAGAEATATIVGPSPLRVTVTLALPPPFTGANPDIQQNEAGPIPQNVTATVTVKNTGGAPIENVTLPSSLTIGWHGPAPINALPIKQVGAPATLKLGTIAPGASSRRSEYTVQVEGDGYFDIQALVTGSEGSEPVHALGTNTIEPTSQLLVMKNSLGAFVHGENNSSLVRAGTHFLVKVQLENRSYVQRLLINPDYPELSGNAQGGEMVREGEPTTFSNPTGALSEVKDSPAIVLEPREKRNYFVIVGTSASDAFAQHSMGGGTRATVTFDTPEVSTLDEEENPTGVADDRVVLTPGSEEVRVGIDESVALPPPFSLSEAAFATGKGLVYGLWNFTYGTVRGIFDLGMLAANGVYDIGAGTLNQVDHIVELWTATENDPAAREALYQTVESKVVQAFAEAPFVLEHAATKTGETLATAIPAAIDAYLTNISNAWNAGDWRQAITDVTETGTTAVALAGPVILKVAGLGAAALKVTSGSLVRLAPVEAAWTAEEAAAEAKAEESLASATKTVEPAETAVEELGKAVRPGFSFSLADLQQFFGISPTEASYLSDFTKARKISVVLRSRAEESLKWLKEGAMLKPYWIKAKTVTWADVQFLGYDAQDVGRVVMREPPTLAKLEAKLAGEGIEEGTSQYQVAVERLQQRTKGYAKEIKEMEEWNRRGTVKGKWPWQENGVNPLVQSDEESTYAFRLKEDPNNPGARVPQIFNPKTRKWGSITGDVDLIAITKADGSALSDADQVQYLKELRNSLLETQHPESLTWVQGEEFWFPAKADYLNAKDLVQFGPDGGRRAVTFNAGLSDPTSWTKLKYRVIWNGGYQVGPGQVP